MTITAKYPCTECGGDAFVAVSAFREAGSKKYIVGKNERLCLKCAKKRGVPNLLGSGKK